MPSLPKNEVSVRIGSIAAGTDDERAVFVAPHDVIIEKIYLTVGTTVAAGATNYTTLSAQNKGADGTETDEMATINTDTGETTLTAYVPTSLGSLSYSTLLKGEAISFKKVDTASGDALDEALVTIVYRASSGLSQYVS